MSFFDRLFGAPTPEPQPRDDAPRGVRSDDERAVERYRYLLETAPPEAIEQVHAEAFAKLTPEQRRLVFAQLTENAPEGVTIKAFEKDGVAAASNPFCGYIVVEAETIEAAARLFEDHPHFSIFPGDGVDIMPFLTAPAS